MPLSPLAERVARYVARPEGDSFDELALAIFEAQYRWQDLYREHCDRLGATPTNVTHWSEIPAVTAAAAKARPPELHAHPELYRRVIEAQFSDACLRDLEAAPILRLLTSRRQAPDSQLSFICSRAVERFGAPSSEVAFRESGLDIGKARSWLASRQRDGRPSLIAATGPSLARLLDTLERQDLRFRLPAGTRLLEAGGFRAPGPREIDEALLERVEARLGMPPGTVVHLRGTSELTSHFYTGTLAGGEPDVFAPPHWTRVRIVEPGGQQEVEAGRAGRLRVFDLANLGSASHIVTDELGIAVEGGFRLRPPDQAENS